MVLIIMFETTASIVLYFSEINPLIFPIFLMTLFFLQTAIKFLIQKNHGFLFSYFVLAYSFQLASELLSQMAYYHQHLKKWLIFLNKNISILENKIYVNYEEVKTKQNKTHFTMFYYIWSETLITNIYMVIDMLQTLYLG